MRPQLRTGPWNLSELKDVPKNGRKVFSCFHCGGGSSMGYKLAGYDVLGGVEIDPEMMAIYRKNHNPKHSFLMGVEEFNRIPREKIPADLFNLDVLDGSPPCSSFSLSGNREKNWGEKKKFREGQTEQILDDLFFHFIETARILQPKVVIAENVKGLVIGKAKGYVKEIAQMFSHAGYDMQLFLLNAAFMGVPQRRERVFFIGTKKSIKLPRLNISFNEPPISVHTALVGLPDQSKLGRPLTAAAQALWSKVGYGEPLSKAHPKGHRFNLYKCDPHKTAYTLTADASNNPIHWSEPRRFTKLECARIQTFPDDYDFGKFQDNYICGMSVPPFMMQRVAQAVGEQFGWFNG